MSVWTTECGNLFKRKLNIIITSFYLQKKCKYRRAHKLPFNAWWNYYIFQVNELKLMNRKATPWPTQHITPFLNLKGTTSNDIFCSNEHNVNWIHNNTSWYFFVWYQRSINTFYGVSLQFLTKISIHTVVLLM